MTDARLWMVRGSVLLFVVVLATPSWLAAQTPVRDRVDYLIDTLLYAPDDDDREDAAEELGKIGDSRALAALERAAAYDNDGGVRKDAYKAIRRIRSIQPVVVAAPATAPAPAVVQAPAPAVVQVPAPVTVAAPAVVAAPAPVVVAPPPVYVAPAPVVVPAYCYSAPVVVARPAYCAPRFGGFFSFSYCHRSHHR